MMRLLAPLVLTFALLPACGGGDGPAPEYTEFDHLTLRGDTTVPAGDYVLRSQAEFDALSVHFVQAPPRTVFPAQMIVGFSKGASRFCSHYEITRVTYEEAAVTVHYKYVFRFIGSSCFSPSPLESGTSGDFVLVPNSGKPVLFVADQ